jgi:hypothetical protein
MTIGHPARHVLERLIGYRPVLDLAEMLERVIGYERERRE